MKVEMKNEKYDSPKIEVVIVELNKVIATSGDIDDYTNENYEW